MTCPVSGVTHDISIHGPDSAEKNMGVHVRPLYDPKIEVEQQHKQEQCIIDRITGCPLSQYQE